MDIENWRLFLRAVQLGSLTAAAEASGYTQSAISHIVAGMEKEFGFSLLARKKSGVTLTRDGERLLPFIRDAVRSADIVRETAEELKELRSGRVSIGAFASVAVRRLPSIIRDFNALYPGIELDLRVDTYKTIEEWLVEGEIDCGFLSNASSKELVFHALAQDRMLAILPNGHELASETAIRIQDVAKFDFIVPGEGTNYDIGRLFRSAGIKPRVRFAVSDDHAAVAMARRGLGVTIVPELLLEGLCETGPALELDPPCRRTIGLAARKNAAASPACRAFVAFVKKCFANEDPS